MNDVNIDFACDTEDCIHWEQGVCKHPASITIQEHCCMEYEHRECIRPMAPESCNFAPTERMEQIAINAIKLFGKLLNGRALYDALVGSLKMDDAEILAAGFTTLKEFMGEGT